ncbi:MAG: hypothetical protein COA33_003520 [Fluviicola sp.]|nr:hypothetical protein [Fluviicola sp.]
MKNVLLIIFTIICTTAIGQVFYKSAGKKDFKLLMDNGVTYIKTGDPVKDGYYIDAIEKYWKVTKVRIFDPLDEDNEEKLSNDDIVFYNASLSGSGDIFCLIKLDFLIKKTVSKYATIGYITINGFSQTSKNLSETLFIDQLIIGLNSTVDVISEDNIKGGGVGLYSKIFAKTLPKVKSLKDKTLLIIGNTKNYISTKALEKNGIKYKEISIEEYEELYQDDLTGYCLFYFAYNTYTEVAIYDLENNELIYTRHFASAKLKLTLVDIAKIARQWK